MNPKDKAYQRAYKGFRERLIKARTDAAMTQVEVNERMGKPHSFMSKCELEEKASRLCRIAKILAEDLFQEPLDSLSRKNQTDPIARWRWTVSISTSLQSLAG